MSVAAARSDSAAQWARLKELLADALDLSQAERDEWLERVGETDPDLRGELAALLACEADAERLIAPLEQDEADIAEPNRVGAWRLVRELGRGGMGTVWLGEREDGEVRQQAAVKLLRRGLDTDDVLSRFRAERQILADLSHPNIARLIDAGSAADGRPYVVIEFVDGEPIDCWCDRRNLGIEGRLHLFLEVCEAVAHAHQNLVVHRDLKPTNVLVGRDASPRLVDFGIAKLLGQEPGLTQPSRSLRPMTLHYATPEQLLGAPTSTATDVYGLGLLLYELLTGLRPFDAAGDAVLGRVDKRAPPRPSEVALRGSEAGERARRRGCEPARLRRRLQGDLDTIVQRALEVEPNQRFATVERLAGDLRRHLEGRPLESRPGSLASRLVKAARRHALSSALGAALLLALTGLAVSMAIQRGQLAIEGERARTEATAAQQARREAEGATQFLLGLFEVDEVGSAKVDPATARELLSQGVARLEREVAERPLDHARLLVTVSKAYYNLGFYPDAEQLLRRAITPLREQLGSHHRDVRAAELELAAVLNRAGRPAEALELLREIPAAAQEVPSPQRGLLAEVQRERGRSLAILARHDQARAEFEAALEAFGQLGADAEFATTLLDLGGVHQAAGRLSAAEHAYQQALVLREREEISSDRGVAEVYLALGAVALTRGDLEAARRHSLRGLEVLEATSGPNHPDVASANASVAHLELRAGGDYESAEVRLERARSIHRAAFGPQSLALASSTESLGNLRVWQERFDEAQVLLTEALTIREQLLGPTHHRVGMSHLNLGILLADSGRCEEADPYFRKALAINEAALGRNHFLVAGPLHGLGECAMRRGDRQEAHQYFRDCEAILLAVGIAPQHPAFVTLRQNLAATAPP